jgi:polysaccharide chain length determinant protein (PEP-CTERM system associated)
MLPGRKYTPDDYIKILLRGKWIILTPAFLGVMGGLVVSRAQPELYKSQTMIQVLPQRVPDSFVKTTVTSTVEERLKSIEEMIKSRTALEGMITDLNLYPEKMGHAAMEDMVAETASKLELKVASTAPGSWRGPGPANSLRVTFTHPDKQKALQVTQKVTAMLLEENARMRGSQANATSEFLERQLAEKRADLEAQEQKVEAFRQRYAGRLPTQLAGNMQAVTSTQSALTSLVDGLQRDRDRKLMLERLYNDAAAQLTALASMPAAVQASAGGQPSTDPTAVAANASAGQRLAQARANLAAQELRLKPEHPDIRRLKRQISDLEKQVEAEGQQPSPSSTTPTVVARGASPEEIRRREALTQQKAEIETLGRQILFKEGEERRLRAQAAEYQSKIDAIPGVESEWTQLDRDYATKQETYKNLLTNSQAAKIAANLEAQQIGEQFKVLDQPQVSDQATNANRLQINLIGLALGLFLGIAIVGFLEFRDTSFRSESDILNALALPVLATVPFAPSAADLGRERRQRMLLSASGAVMLVACAGVFWYLKLWKFIA